MFSEPPTFDTSSDESDNDDGDDLDFNDLALRRNEGHTLANEFSVSRLLSFLINTINPIQARGGGGGADSAPPSELF